MSFNQLRKCNEHDTFLTVNDISGDVIAAAKVEAEAIDREQSPNLWFEIHLTPDMNHNMTLIRRAEGNLVDTQSNLTVLT